jgi:hypothetical protein
MRLLNELADDPILMKVRGSSERDDEQVPSHPCNHNTSAVLSMKGRQRSCKMLISTS